MVFADECLGGVVEKARHEKNPLHSCWVRIYRILGSFAKVSLILSGEKDMEWLMIDATHIKVHPHAAGAKGGNEGMSRTKGG